MQASFISRRSFIKAGTFLIPALSTGFPSGLFAGESILPEGGAPAPVSLSHFPNRVSAFIWRNWQWVPTERIAKTIKATPEQILKTGLAMGLKAPPKISEDFMRRSFITVIRRNWHLIPYEQLLELLEWTEQELAFTLREDDFLYVKLGNLKPKCPTLQYAEPTPQEMAQIQHIARLVHQHFPEGLPHSEEPLFGFISDLTQSPVGVQAPSSNQGFNPRFCYSYFALYGDPFVKGAVDPYPDGYLARMAQSGVNGVWLQGLLQKLAPFPWNSGDGRFEERLENLRNLISRARRYGIGLYLYLNEPRSMPTSFFKKYPDLKGVPEGDYAALCISHPEVKQYLRESVSYLCKNAPDLAGIFTISGSENLTHCWSHGSGKNCQKCSKRSPSEVVAESNNLIMEGIRQAKSKTQLIVWDWGWNDDWTPDIIQRLSPDVTLMSVSEWSIPLQRGGVKAQVGEYSVSIVGPGPRASRHWALAKKRGLKTIAKIQAAISWELSSVPYLPVLKNIVQHALNIRKAGVDGLMLGWTLGGYPSINLEAAYKAGLSSVEPKNGNALNSILMDLAEKHYGKALATAMVEAWEAFSEAMNEFPYHGGLLYCAPMQFGPSNLLWSRPTGYRATMIGFPYDDLHGWRAAYPEETFVNQFLKVSSGFEAVLDKLRKAIERERTNLSSEQRQKAIRDANVVEAAAIHFRSTANQGRFVMLRQSLTAEKDDKSKQNILQAIQATLRSEIDLAKRLAQIQSQDSRIGYEASNQYYYGTMDLGEKVLNCEELLRTYKSNTGNRK